MNRLLVETEPHSGAWNMAVDEFLLESAVEQGDGALRFYRWSEPTVSLGYFQKPEEASTDERLAGLPVVKRLSGGGAILHQHEWTYSLALPSGHPLGRVPVEVYDRVHEAVVGWLQSEGVPASLRRDSADRHANSQFSKITSSELPSGAEESDGAGGRKSSADQRPREPFLCFGRGDPRDVVLHGMKILGSAQRRRRGVILQHGSLLLRGSPFAPQFPGLLELSNRSDLADALPGELVRRIAPLWGDSLHPTTLTDAERIRVSHLAAIR